MTKFPLRSFCISGWFQSQTLEQDGKPSPHVHLSADIVDWHNMSWGRGGDKSSTRGQSCQTSLDQNPRTRKRGQLGAKEQVWEYCPI